MLSGRLPKVLQARIGVRQPTVFLRAARTPRSGSVSTPGQVLDAATLGARLANRTETLRKLNRPPTCPRRVDSRGALASKYLYLLQVLFFICPRPG